MRNAAPPISNQDLIAEQDSTMPSVPAQHATESFSPGKFIGGAIDRLEPSLRVVNIIAGCLGIFISPIAYETTRQKIWMIIALAPLLLSAILAVYRLLQRLHRERRAQSQQLPRFSCLMIAIFDLILATAHCTILVGVYIVISGMYGRTSGVILGTWLSFLLLIDFLIHAVLFLNALPKLVKREPSPSISCPRCGFEMPGVDEPAIKHAITEIIKNLDNKQQKGDYSLLGRYVDDDDSDFGTQGPSGRTSQETR